MRPPPPIVARAWFRALVAVAFVLFHVAMVREMGKSRYDYRFNSAPGAAPAFIDPAESMSAGSPANWSRLVVARWDSQHYEGIALRGFSQCPKKDMRKADLANVAKYCDFSFYPGYPLLGRIAALGGRIPIDYALFGVALVASVTFLFMWTSRPIRDALGTRGAYLSLLLFNAFPTAFALGTIQTEPCVLAFTLGSVIALARARYVLAAFLAGAATGVRISALATAAACGIAILASLWIDRPRSRGAWTARVLAVPLSGWGVFLIAGFFYRYYSDPLLYVHTHQAAYRWLESKSLWDRLDRKFIFAVAGIDAMHRAEGLWIAASIGWLALGVRGALAGFAPLVRLQLWVLTAFGTAVSLLGSWPLGFLGMNRYWLLVMPLFLSIAQVVRRAPAALLLWLAVSSWAYWNVDLCDYVAQEDPGRCGFIR